MMQKLFYKHVRSHNNLYVYLLGFALLLIFYSIMYRAHAPYEFIPCDDGPSDNITISPRQIDNARNPVLLSKYVYLGNQPDFTAIQYRPRQFVNGVVVPGKDSWKVTDTGTYSGWDMLPVAGKTNGCVSHRVTLVLNRPAVVAVALKGNSLPSWLNGWRKSTDISLNTTPFGVYKKVVKAKTVTLGSTVDGSNYMILLAESNEKPSTAPIVLAAKTIPQPNKPCPTWVHDQYVTTGPDGKTYPTWHPQIDPVYWCYFGHEHGTDPALFASNINVPFGYAGEKMDEYEAHPGFKVYVWDDTSGYRWLAVQHQGTSSNQAACGQFHELDIAVKKKSSNTILAQQYFLGDYGASRLLQTNQPLQPSQCLNQGKIVSGGIKYLPVKNTQGIHTEAWTVSNKNVIGFNFSDFTINTHDSARVCNDITCDTVSYTGDTGTYRTVGYVYGFGPKAGKGHEGIFYTDSLGHTLLTADDPHAVKQYIQPGVTISSDINRGDPKIHYIDDDCQDLEGFNGLYICGPDLHGVPTARENSIHIPN